MENKDKITYKVFLTAICFISIVVIGFIAMLLCVELIVSARRDLGRYIYATHNQVKVTFTITPEDGGNGLVLLIYDDSIPPKEISKHSPIARYHNFWSNPNNDFYCGVRDSVCPEEMFLWVRPYGKKDYAYDSQTVHFCEYIHSQDSLFSNVFDINFGLLVMDVKPNCKKELIMYEMPWYRVLFNKLLGI